MPVAKKKTVAKSTGRKIDWTVYGARVADESEDFTWKAVAEGDSVLGTIKSVEEVNTRYGQKAIIKMTDVDHVVSDGETHDLGTGQLLIIWPTPGLIDEMSKSGADEGDVVEIELAELVDTGKGNPFKQFSVEVQK